MEDILDQIRATFDCGIWYPVVSCLLMLPDTCGAVEFWSQNKTSSQRYIEWYDRWVAPNFRPSFRFDGSVVYVARNAMLHESTGFTRGTHGFDRIMFMPPNKRDINTTMRSSNNGGVAETAVQIVVSEFLDVMEIGVRNWMRDVRNDVDKRRENATAKLLQYRPNGQPPHLIGLPTIS